VTLIVFDVDGTLVDSQRLILAAQAEAFGAHGLPPMERERALSVVGLSLPQAFASLVGPDGPVESLAEAYKNAFQALRANPAYHEPLFPGAEAILAALAARPGVALGIATGKSRRGVDHLLERHGWGALFSTIQTADDAPSKPDPGMLLNAMAETGRHPGETIMIGDTGYDMAMAGAAGALGIGVTWGYHDAAMLEAAGARHLGASFPEVLAIIDAALGSAGHRAGAVPPSAP
jgi:phosphoglycolate phosphatase